MRIDLTLNEPRHATMRANENTPWPILDLRPTKPDIVTPGGSKEEPFGTKGKAWIAKNINKAVDGTWKVGIAVATKVLTEAVLKYYGYK